MNGNPLKALIFVFFLFSVILAGSAKSFAQSDDNSSDEQAREEQTQQTLDQIHDLEVKMQENAKRLDALEKSVDQADTQTNSTTQAAPEQEAPVEQVPLQEAPAQTVAPVEPAPTPAVVPVQAVAPVQMASAPISPEDQSMAEIKAEPVDVLPEAPLYYSPLTGFPKEHTFELSQEEFYSTYRQTENNKRGEFYGVNTAYTYRPLDSEYWPINIYHLEVHGDYGVLDYDDGEGDKEKNIKNYIVEPRAWMGKDLNLGSIADLTPYMGVGYRWYYEDLKNKMSSEEVLDNLDFQAKSSDEETQYVYIPFGGQLSFRPTYGWRVDMNSEYDLLVWGRVTNYSPDFTVDSLPIYSHTTNNTLRNGYGIRGSIKFTKEGDTYNYFVEPYIRYWNIRSSNTVSDSFTFEGINLGSIPIQQDKNTTTEVGARVGVEF